LGKFLIKIRDKLIIYPLKQIKERKMFELIDYFEKETLFIEEK